MILETSQLNEQELQLYVSELAKINTSMDRPEAKSGELTFVVDPSMGVDMDLHKREVSGELRRGNNHRVNCVGTLADGRPFALVSECLILGRDACSGGVYGKLGRVYKPDKYRVQRTGVAVFSKDRGKAVVYVAEVNHKYVLGRDFERDAQIRHTPCDYYEKDPPPADSIESVRFMTYAVQSMSADLSMSVDPDSHDQQTQRADFVTTVPDTVAEVLGTLKENQQFPIFTDGFREYIEQKIQEVKQQGETTD